MTDPKIRYGDRRIVAEWRVDDTHFATLSVYHTGSKSFSATLRQEEEMSSGVRGFMVFDGITIARERVARYSPKLLKEFFERALDVVREGHAEGKYDSIFNPPAVEEEAA